MSIDHSTKLLSGHVEIQVWRVESNGQAGGVNLNTEGAHIFLYLQQSPAHSDFLSLLAKKTGLCLSLATAGSLDNSLWAW